MASGSSVIGPGVFLHKRDLSLLKSPSGAWLKFHRDDWPAFTGLVARIASTKSTTTLICSMRGDAVERAATGASITM